MKISVIIPVLNDAQSLMKCLFSLEKQTFGRDNLEVIVVDNGSSDESLDIAKEAADFVFSTTKTENPYVARNAGIQAASNDFIILLDAKCIPELQSIENIYKSHIRSNAALSSGEIKFTFSPSPTFGEWIDSMIFIRAKECIHDQDGLPGGSLWLFHKDLIEQIGLFREDTRSGADSDYALRVWKNGLKINYVPDAIVRYKARNLSALLRKGRRIGKGQLRLARSNRDFNLLTWYLESLIRMRPPSPAYIRFCLNERMHVKKAPFSFLQLSMGIWLYRIFHSFGRLGL